MLPGLFLFGHSGLRRGEGLLHNGFEQIVVVRRVGAPVEGGGHLTQGVGGQGPLLPLQNGAEHRKKVVRVVVEDRGVEEGAVVRLRDQLRIAEAVGQDRVAAAVDGLLDGPPKNSCRAVDTATSARCNSRLYWSKSSA